MSSTAGMRALYDIHGDLQALEAVLDDVHEVAVDLVLVGGGRAARELVAGGESDGSG